MKKILCLLQLSLLGCIFAVASVGWGDLGNGFYRNPVLYADFSDPDVIRVGDRYYMVASDFHFMGMQVLESPDLVRWHYISQIYRSLPFDAYDANERYGGGSWAPSIREHDGTFYVYFCTPHEGLFVSTATDPAGPWTAPLLVKAVEKWEDPCPFWDDDGQAYLGHSLHGAGPIIVHRMSADGTRLLDDGVTVYRGPVAEGTKIHKFGDMYYMSIPEGGVGTGWQTILRAPSIYGPYERREVLHQGCTSVNGPHQGALVDSPDGSLWFIHFQETEAAGRVVHLQPAMWGEDGWPRLGVDIDGDGIGEPVDTWRKPCQAPETATLATSDDFTAPTLGLQWQTNHNPVPGAVSLEDPHGCLTLSALRAPDFRHARNTITQKAVGAQGTFTVSMCVDSMAIGQRSGVACMGKGNRLLGVKMAGSAKYIYVSNDTLETVVAPVGDDCPVVYLRFSYDFPARSYSFSYSTDGKHYRAAGEPFFLKWGHWKGIRPAIYTYNTGDSGGKARFRWVDYVHDGNMAPATATGAFCRSEEDSIVSGIARTSFPARSVRVTPGLAVRAGSARAAINQAIDSCSEAGGGTVYVDAGVYEINGSLVLKSNVNLHLASGALLRFSGRADDFLPPVFTRWEGTELYGHSPMIYALHAGNIAITGDGVVDARADVEMAAWAQLEAADRDSLRAQGGDLAPVQTRVYGAGTLLRPVCIEMVGCSRVLIEDITVKNSPFWTIHPLYCDNVVVSGVIIDSHFANNDGCDPESSSNVLIENCRFDVGDDAIAIKSGRDADGRRVGRPSENIVIRNCIFNSECNGLCIGSEMSGGVQNVYMHDIRIGTVKNAIYFKSNRDRGGYIRGVHVSDIAVDHTLGAVLRFETNYFGSRGGTMSSQYEDFRISNVYARRSDRYAMFISGYPEKPVRNVLVENMTVGSAPVACYMHCTEDVRLLNVVVDGVLLPECPPDDPVERTLDVY